MEAGFAHRYGPWAVVTGAGTGVGLAFVDELLARGLGVVMVDVDPGVADVATDRDGPTRACVADVADEDWIDELTAACDGAEVGLAVANAGVSTIGWYLELPPARRRAIIDVNCRAVAEMASWALPGMVERGRGGFVATSSGSALAGTAGVALYSATKAFTVNLVEAIGWELRHTGVDVQAVVAPTMATPGLASSQPDPSKMPMPPADPRDVVRGALDALPQGGRWLADDGLAFAAALPRDERVALLSSTTTGMYPEVFGADGGAT